MRFTNEEELVERADRILEIAKESKSSFVSLTTLCDALACYAVRCAKDHEEVKKRLHILLDESYEGYLKSYLKEVENEPNDAA